MTSDLSAEMRAVMMRQAALAGAGPSRYAMPFPESRRSLELQREWWQDGAPPCALTQFEIDGVACVRFTPRRCDASAIVVYLHGGGWCVGDSVRTHGAVLAWIAQESGCEVIGVDYALAPEHPFPRAVNDVRCVLDHLLGEARRVVLAGDSAGANLALVDTLARRDSGGVLPRGLLLYYGTYGPVRRDGSFARFGGGEYGLSLAALDRYAAAYAPGQEASRDVRLYPIYASLHALPPMAILAASCDPLLDDSRALAAQARAAGVTIDYREEPGVTHGFLAYWRMLDAARTALGSAGERIRAWVDQ